MMKTLEDILAEQPFFKDLGAAHLQVMAGCASNVVFKEGEYLFREGQEANRFYVIRHGEVALEVFAPGRGPIVIETISASDIVGWSWLVPPYTHRFDARAVELVRATAFDGACIRQKCEEDTNLGYMLLKRVAVIRGERLQATRLQLLDLYGAQT